MSTGAPEDAALEALLRESEVSKDVDPLGLPSRSSDVVTPLRMPAKREPGGGAVSAQTGKKYCLRLLSKKEGFCLKDIGDGATFCLRVNCTTKHSGAQQVFVYEQDGLFVIGKTKDTAFSSPVLRQNQVSRDVWEEDWQDTTKPLDDWQRLFQAASFNSTATNKASLKVEAERVTQLQLFKTPGKKVKRTFDESKLDDFSPYKEILYSTAKVAQFKKSVVDKTLQNLVPSMDKGLSDVAEAVEVLTNESRKLLLSFEDGLDKVSVKVASFADSLGSERDTGDSALVAPTLWGLVGSINSALGGQLDERAKLATKVNVEAARSTLAQQAKANTVCQETGTGKSDCDCRQPNWAASYPTPTSSGRKCGASSKRPSNDASG